MSATYLEAKNPGVELRILTLPSGQLKRKCLEPPSLWKAIIMRVNKVGGATPRWTLLHLRPVVVCAGDLFGQKEAAAAPTVHDVEEDALQERDLDEAFGLGVQLSNVSNH